MILTIRDAIALQTIIQAAQTTAKVARAVDGGEVILGTARHIVKSPTDIGFLNADEDVRDGYLRVTLQNGFEAFWLVRELMPEAEAGLFALYDW